MTRYSKTRSQSSPKVQKIKNPTVTILAAYIKLEPWQTEQLEAIKAVATRAGKDGKPGMILCQICEDEMRCGFIEHERARLLAKHDKTIHTLEDVRKREKQRKH